MYIIYIWNLSPVYTREVHTSTSSTPTCPQTFNQRDCNTWIFQIKNGDQHMTPEKVKGRQRWRKSETQPFGGGVLQGKDRGSRKGSERWRKVMVPLPACRSWIWGRARGIQSLNQRKAAPSSSSLCWPTMTQQSTKCRARGDSLCPAVLRHAKLEASSRLSCYDWKLQQQ